MRIKKAAIAFAAAAGLLLGMPALASELRLPRHKVDLVAPPYVHAHQQVNTGGPRIVEFRLVVDEKEIAIDDQGTKLQSMNFNGSIPGPLMVVQRATMSR